MVFICNLNVITSFRKILFFLSRSGPYELQAEGEKETIIQKFNRIKCEMAELEQEIAQTKVPSYLEWYYLIHSF